MSLRSTLGTWNDFTATRSVRLVEFVQSVLRITRRWEAERPPVPLAVVVLVVVAVVVVDDICCSSPVQVQKRAREEVFSLDEPASPESVSFFVTQGFFCGLTNKRRLQSTGGERIRYGGRQRVSATGAERRR